MDHSHQRRSHVQHVRRLERPPPHSTVKAPPTGCTSTSWSISSTDRDPGKIMQCTFCSHFARQGMMQKNNSQHSKTTRGIIAHTHRTRSVTAPERSHKTPPRSVSHATNYHAHCRRQPRSTPNLPAESLPTTTQITADDHSRRQSALQGEQLPTPTSTADERTRHSHAARQAEPRSLNGG